MGHGRSRLSSFFGACRTWQQWLGLIASSLSSTSWRGYLAILHLSEKLLASYWMSLLRSSTDGRKVEQVLMARLPQMETLHSQVIYRVVSWRGCDCRLHL